MKTARLGALVLVLVALAGCGQGGAGILTREVTAAIAATGSQSREYRYVDQALDGTERIVVDGKVQDDLRYSGTVSMNGKKLYQTIVSDDSVAVRLLDTARTKPAIDIAQRVDAITARALSEGRWVVDHTVAPPLIAAAAAPEEEQTADRSEAGGSRRQQLVGDDPLTDAAQALSYSERAVRSGFQVERFNPEDIEYNALDDPWAADADRELEDQGLRRYDLRQPPLPGPAERGKQQSLPTIEHFRKMAVYARGKHVVEIRERISLTDRREFRRAEAGRQARFYLTLRDRALAGQLQDELRQRDMNYKVTTFKDVDIKVPLEAEEGILADVLPALKEVFGFEFIGGGGAQGLPGVSPPPGGSPPASGSPAASPDIATASP